METCTSATKRKKRKTRKHLDEIRKRSRSNTHLVQKNTGIASESTSTNYMKTSKLVTSTRITLTMCHKAVRSETVTRPCLMAENQATESHTASSKGNICIKQHPKIDTVIVSNTDNESFDSPAAYQRCNEIQNKIIRNDSNSDYIRNCNDSPTSPVLFSPPDRTPNDVDILEVSANEVADMSDGSSHSSRTSRTEFAYQLYEEFIKEIPSHLKEQAPLLLKDDWFTKAKMKLHTMYMDSSQRESKEDMLHCVRDGGNGQLPSNRSFAIQDTAPEIVENPRDYLRLSCGWRRQASVVMARRSSSEQQSPSSGVTLPTPRSPHANTPSTHSIINDTPEYTYFPHKLNQ